MLRFALLATMAISAPALAAGDLSITSRVMVEQRVAASDGTTRTRLAPATRVVPGDRLVVTVAYRNTGRAAISNLAIVNPVPAGLTYRGVAAGAVAPEVSSDGVRFAPFASLAVAGRAAPAITHVRWRLASPVAPGSGGQFAFQAVLK